MDGRNLTSTETEARKKHADITMAKWIALRKNLKVCTIPDDAEVLGSMMDEASGRLTYVSFQEADRSTLSTFCLYLQILALSLLSDYNSQDARALLARDEVSILQIFFENEEGLDPESVDLAQADHIMALAHGLFEAAGGSKSTLWDHIDNEYSDFDNQRLCGFMVDVVGMMSLEEAHAAQLYHAMLRSKLLVRNKTPSFAMFLKYIEDCRSVIDPAQRRCFTERSNGAERH